MNNQCAKCGSEKVVPLARISHAPQTFGGQLTAYVFSNPKAWFFRGVVFATLKARICGECGHTELIAQDSARLYEAYRQAAGQQETEA